MLATFFVLLVFVSVHVVKIESDYFNHTNGSYKFFEYELLLLYVQTSVYLRFGLPPGHRLRPHLNQYGAPQTFSPRNQNAAHLHEPWRVC